MPNQRTIFHIHCKATNEDWYFITLKSMEPVAYKFPISIRTIQRQFASIDYFERKGFYFRKSRLALKQPKRGTTKHFQKS